MIEELLLWTLAAYGCASLVAALLRRFGMRWSAVSNEPLVHYHILLYNSDQLFEREVRQLTTRSYWQGERLRISFTDYGSTDNTLKMKDIYEREYDHWPEEYLADGQIVTIDLRRSDG